jgi:hypothetical protein
MRHQQLLDAGPAEQRSHHECSLPLLIGRVDVSPPAALFDRSYENVIAIDTIAGKKR